jgi:hypothetical protein
MTNDALDLGAIARLAVARLQLHAEKGAVEVPPLSELLEEAAAAVMEISPADRLIAAVAEAVAITCGLPEEYAAMFDGVAEAECIRAGVTDCYVKAG